jgi:hypothetical protein
MQFLPNYGFPRRVRADFQLSNRGLVNHVDQWKVGFLAYSRRKCADAKERQPQASKRLILLKMTHKYPIG